MYDVFMDSFDTFPLSCVINGKFIAVHGGISPELRTVLICDSILLVGWYQTNR